MWSCLKWTAGFCRVSADPRTLRARAARERRPHRQAQQPVALTAGADDYLEMPFRRQELLVKVARLTERTASSATTASVEQAADIIYTRDNGRPITSITKRARFFGRPCFRVSGRP